MNACLSRIFRRTPSLRTRVAFASASPRRSSSLIVGTVVWVGITNDRKERLDRRLDEAAGFAIPFLPRGLDEIPKSPNDQDAVITVRKSGQVTSNSNVVLPELPAGLRGHLRQRRAVPRAHRGDPGARADVGRRRRHLRRHHRRHQQPASPGDHHLRVRDRRRGRVRLAAGRIRGAPAQTAWPEQTSQIDAGDEPPDIDVRGATEAVEIADAVKGMLERIWKEQDRTKAALASARDFSAVSAHELRTPLTAMRTNLEVLSTLDLPEEQRKEVVNDVIRTQSRIEATLGALERLAQGELSTSDDHVPVDITELLDRAAHDAMRVYPDLDVSLVPAPTVIIVGLPAGLRLAVDNAIANAVKHGGATQGAVVGGQFARRGGDRDRRRRRRHPRRGAQGGVRPVHPRVDGVALRLRAWPCAGRPAGRITRRHSLFGGQPAGRRAAAAAAARAQLVRPSPTGR